MIKYLLYSMIGLRFVDIGKVLKIWLLWKICNLMGIDRKCFVWILKVDLLIKEFVLVRIGWIR